MGETYSAAYWSDWIDLESNVTRYNAIRTLHNFLVINSGSDTIVPEIAFLPLHTALDNLVLNDEWARTNLTLALYIFPNLIHQMVSYTQLYYDAVTTVSDSLTDTISHWIRDTTGYKCVHQSEV